MSNSNSHRPPAFSANNRVFTRLLMSVGAVLFFQKNASGQGATVVDAGLRFEMKKGAACPVVAQVWRFSSAEDEGIRTGETVWTLDGATTEGLSPQELASRLGGKEGDRHTLTVGPGKREVRVKLRRLKGKCTSGDCTTGRGVWDDPDARYEGDFVKGKYEGKGVMTYLSGNRHEGAYRAGKREGPGKFFFATGTVYEGNFSNNNFNGEGKLKYKTGETYEGEFLDDERNGEGLASWPNGDRYEGFWSGDLRNGQGTMHYADGGVYTGSWKAGKRDGFGHMTSFEGWTYEGNWSNDLRHGFGKLRQRNGERIEGNFRNDGLPLDARPSDGPSEPAAARNPVPAIYEPNREEASSPPAARQAPSPGYSSPAIEEFLKNAPQKPAPKTAPSPKPAGAATGGTGALRPGGTDGLPTAANRKMPTNLTKDGGPHLRAVKVLDGFFDNAAAADNWLADNSRIARREDRADNIKGLSTMAATWAASARSKYETFSGDLDAPLRDRATGACDLFLKTNTLLAEKYTKLANLLAFNTGPQEGDGRSPEIEAVEREITNLWPRHEELYLAARKFFW